MKITVDIQCSGASVRHQPRRHDMAKETTPLGGFYGVTYTPTFGEEGLVAVIAAFVSISDAREYVAKWDRTMGGNGKHAIVAMNLVREF